MNATVIEVPDVQGIKTEGSSIVEMAEKMIVQSDAQENTADQLTKLISEKEKLIHEKLDDKCNAAFKLHKSLTALRTELLEPWLAARRIIMNKILDWQEKKAKERREAEERLQKAQQKAEEDAKLEQAQAAAESGNPDLAEQILNAPTPAPRAILPKPEKISDVTFREKHYGVVMNFSAFARAAVANPAWLYLLTADQSALDKLAGATKGQIKVPGVDFKIERIPIKGRS